MKIEWKTLDEIEALYPSTAPRARAMDIIAQEFNGWRCSQETIPQFEWDREFQAFLAGMRFASSELLKDKPRVS